MYHNMKDATSVRGCPSTLNIGTRRRELDEGSATYLMYCQTAITTFAKKVAVVWTRIDASPAFEALRGSFESDMCSC